MKADILKLLLQSHAERDESSFRKAALQLAAAESNAGQVRVAEEIRAIIAKMPATAFRKPQGPVVDIAAPRALTVRRATSQRPRTPRPPLCPSGGFTQVAIARYGIVLSIPRCRGNK